MKLTVIVACRSITHHPAISKAKPVFSIHLMRSKSPGKARASSRDTMAGLNYRRTCQGSQCRCPSMEEPPDQHKRLLRPQRFSSASGVPLEPVQLSSAAQ